MPKSNDQLSAEQLLRIVLDTIPLRVFWKDLDLNYLGANQKLLDDIGFANLNDLVGQSDYAIFETPEQAEPKRLDDRTVITTGEAKLNIEEALPIPGKKCKWLRTNKVPMRTTDGKIIGVLGTYQDITEEVEYRQLIEHQALIDPLTNLANRRRLQNEIQQNKHAKAGLLFIDLDRFKNINDTLGHLIGDQLLQSIATRFQRIANKHDALLARLGGDEFSILKVLSDSPRPSATLTQIASDILSMVNVPITLDNNVINISASIGITTMDNTAQSTIDCFTQADLAMYSAKTMGGNNYQFFKETLRTAAARKHQLYTNLKQAIEKQELYLMFQPQFDTDGELIGAEALLRWQSQALGAVMPSEFIPIAEESGMIHSIGAWVITESLRQLTSWHPLTKAQSNFKLGVNVSSKQFSNPDFPSFVKQQLEHFNLNPKHLELELTESLLFEHQNNAVFAIEQLKAIGVSIAIDDFGTGYSSLSYLATLPLDKLKIDRSFVINLHQNDTNKKLVETIINLASSLNVGVIAEGVEIDSEKLSLVDLNCNEFQGYLFSHPLTLEQFQRTYHLLSPT